MEALFFGISNDIVLTLSRSCTMSVSESFKWDLKACLLYPKTPASLPTANCQSQAEVEEAQKSFRMDGSFVNT